MSNTAGSSTGGLDWLMEKFVQDVPHTQAVQLASADGLPVARHGLDKDRSDYLSAITSGHMSLFNNSLRQQVTDSPKTVHQVSVIDVGDTIVIIVSAGEGGILTALAEPHADAGFVGHELGELVKRVGDHLGVAPREIDGAAAQDPLD